MIYEKLKTDLEAKQVKTWYCTMDTLMVCENCEVERSCCQKRKLTLAMTSQILDWLKRHQSEVKIIETLASSPQHNTLTMPVQ